MFLDPGNFGLNNRGPNQIPVLRSQFDPVQQPVTQYDIDYIISH